EEFLPPVDLVHLPVKKPSMQLSFERWGVVGSDHGVDVEGEGDSGIAKLADPLRRVEPPGEPELVDIFPEGTEVRYDVYVSLLRLLRHGDRLPGLLLCLGQLGVQVRKLGLELCLFRIAGLLDLFPEPLDSLVHKLFLACGLLDCPLNLSSGPLLFSDLLPDRPLLFPGPFLELLHCRRPLDLLES